MIYGKIDLAPNSVTSLYLQKLKDLVAWPGCIHHQIEWRNFSGGFMYDPALPYKPEDFYILDPGNDLMILMSGSIYNRIEISERLSVNHAMRTGPQFILAAYLKWGEDFVQELNGDFAIFIYQKSTQQSLFYRDHLGIRPLAFSKSDDVSWFSSDATALCKVLHSNEGVNRYYLLNNLVKYGLQSTTSLIPVYTLLPNKNVQKVSPAHFLKQSEDGIIEKKYWCPEVIREDLQLDFETAKKEIKALLLDAVKIRCDQRFKAATHLSGGLDSGIVASLAKKEYKDQKEFQGFCWTPVEKVNGQHEYDERELVNSLANHCGISSIFTTIYPTDYMNFLSEGRSETDLFYEFKVRENGKLNNVNLVFSGWGGDEFISYNNKGIDSDLLFKFQWRSFLKKNPITKPKKFIGALLYEVILPALALRNYTPQKKLAHYSKYIHPVSFDNIKTMNDFNSWRSRREMHLRLLYQFHLPERTEDWYTNGSRTGIEYRYPLLDKRIVELMLKIPSRLLFKNGYGRIFIREISEGLLPEAIRWNVSKNDPVRSLSLDELEDTVCLQLMDEVNEFKNNRQLDFINFDKLISDIEAYKKGLITKRPYESFEILLFLKKAHEFSKWYNN